MSRENFVDYLHRKYLTRKKYIENLVEHLTKIKEICRSADPSCRTILFGSYIRGTARPDSDIDVLLITKLAKNHWTRAKLYTKISENLDPEHPFEIRIATPEEYEKWYKKSIDIYKEI